MGGKGSGRKRATTDNGEVVPRFVPPPRRPYATGRNGDPRYVTLTHDPATGYCTGYVLKHPDGYLRIAELSAEGVSLALMAAALGIGLDAWNRLRNDDPQVAEMIEMGRAALTSEVIDHAVQHMRAGDKTMTIWLGKVRCSVLEQTGQVEGVRNVTNNTQPDHRHPTGHDG